MFEIFGTSERSLCVVYCLHGCFGCYKTNTIEENYSVWRLRKQIKSLGATQFSGCKDWFLGPDCGVVRQFMFIISQSTFLEK